MIDIEIRILFGSHPLFCLAKDLVEFLFFHPQSNFPEELNKSPVGIIGESSIRGDLDQTLKGLVV